MRPAAARTVRATGILQFDERRLATVTTKVPGWIEYLAMAATGDPVRRGQVVAEIYSPDLVASEEEYLVAARIGGAMAAASVQRLRALDIPEEEITRLRRTGRSARRIAVVASADGVVIDKPVQQGMRVDAGEALYRTADLSDIWLIAQVQEQDIGAIVPGQPARATFVAFPGRTFEGTVDFIYPSLSAETRTARVRIVIPNADRALRAAMFANVRMEAPASTGPVLTIPNSAVLDSGTRQMVLVADGEGRFEPRQVRLGIHGDDRVQVLDGLRQGERVVVGANFLIDAESNLRAALQGFTQGAKP
jgi:Cu(I)/Ag(I) efflux system membrane fusion protein